MQQSAPARRGCRYRVVAVVRPTASSATRARPPSARLLLSCLQHPGAWLAAAATNSGVKRPRAPCAPSARSASLAVGYEMPVEYQKQGAAGRRARRHLPVLHVCRRHGTAVTAFGSDRQLRARRARDRGRGHEGSRDRGGRRDRGLAEALAASVGAPMIKAIPGSVEPPSGRAAQRRRKPRSGAGSSGLGGRPSGGFSRL